MLIRRPPDIRESEVTERRLYINRRKFIGRAARLGASLGLVGAVSPLVSCGRDLGSMENGSERT